MINKQHRLRHMLVLLFLLAISSFAGLARSAAQTSPKYVVAFAQDTMANDWRIAQVRQMAEAFAAYPEVKFIYSDGKGRSARQIQDIENFVYQKVDVLLASPSDSLAATPVISKAYRAGIPVVMVSRSIASEDYTSFVAPDNYRIGFDAATYMASKLQGRGRIVMLSGIPTSSTAQERSKGFRDALRDYPDMQLVADKVANYLRADAIRAVEELVTTGVEFEGIYAQSDSMATGARLALNKAGIDPRDKLIVGIDYIAEAREAIRSGEQAASFLYPTSAREAAQLVMKILRGEAVPKRVMVDSVRITTDNVEIVAPIF